MLTTTSSVNATTKPGSCGGRVAGVSTSAPVGCTRRVSSTANAITGGSIATQQLHQRGGVAGLASEAAAGADDPRHIVDRAAKEDAGRLRVEPAGAKKHRVQHHHQRRQRADADHREQRARSFCGCEGSASAADAPQIATAPSVSSPNRPREPINFAAAMPAAIVAATAATTSSTVCQPRATKLVGRDAQPEQRDAEAQHLLRCELDAGLAGRVGRHQAHRQPEQQRE